MAQTVAECLTAATDSVTVINDINTNGNKSRYAGGKTDADGNAVAGDWEQTDINAVVQRNVDHLEIILAYGNKSRYAGGKTDADGNAVAGDWEQTDINAVVQRNVDHLEIILAYAPVDEDDETPDVAGSSEDKSSYTTAITTGKAYIAAN